MIIKQIEIAQIEPDPNQPRTNINNLKTLADSIQKEGLIYPIEIKPHNDKFIIIDGERRYTAIRDILKWDKINCIITEKVDNILLRQLATDFQKDKLNFIEQARAIQRLIDSGMIKSEICQVLGISRSKIDFLQRLLSLSEYTQKQIIDKKIGYDNIRKLLSAGNIQNEEEVVHRIIKEEPRNDAAFNKIIAETEDVDFILNKIILAMHKFNLTINELDYKYKLMSRPISMEEKNAIRNKRFETENTFKDIRTLLNKENNFDSRLKKTAFKKLADVEENLEIYLDQIREE